jgi:hypothetical protein
MTKVRRRNGGLTFAAMAFAVVANGCDLVDPVKRDEFTLVRVNGKPVPYTISRSPGYFDSTEILEVRWARGTVVMFLGGRLDWELFADRLFNGAPREDFPPHRNHVIDGYSINGDTLRFRGFEGRFVDAGRGLSMKDKEGRYDFATFEFERR